MDLYIKLSAQTAGKDKIIRLLQYASKLIAHVLGNLRVRAELADQLRHLEFQLSSFRKLMRFGKSVEVLYGTLKLVHLPDIVLRTLLSLSRIAQVIFLFADHIIWLGRAGFVKIHREKWSRLANRCWIYSITLNLLRDFYEISRLSPSSRNRLVLTNPSAVLHSYSSLRIALKKLVQSLLGFLNHRAVTVDVAKNICDLFIPLSSEGYLKISPGLIGLLGVLSSIAGIVAMVDPTARLAP